MRSARFIRDIGGGFRDIVAVYWRVIRRPWLLAVGAWVVAKDLLIELPRSLVLACPDPDVPTRLNRCASQALALSEVATVPGTFAGVALAKALGLDDYSASVGGGSVGNYLSGAGSYVLAYSLITRRVAGYAIRPALVDALVVVRDCFPVSLSMYMCEAPVISGLLAIGVPRTMAVGLNLAVGMVLFTGVAKVSSSQRAEMRR